MIQRPAEDESRRHEETNHHITDCKIYQKVIHRNAHVFKFQHHKADEYVAEQINEYWDGEGDNETII